MARLPVAPEAGNTMKAASIAICFLSVLASKQPQPPGDLQLFLLIGQSNMAGRGIVEAQDREVLSHIFVLDKSLEWAPAIDPLHFDKPAIAGVGLGRSFAKELAAASPGASIGLIPAAFGGTTLLQWQRDGALYEEAVRRTKAAMRSGTLRGILWHQGEGDADSAEKASTYRDRFSQFISGLRQDLGAPDAPVVVGELGRFFSDRAPYGKVVNEQLALISRTVPRVALASSFGLRDKGDGVHFDSVSLRELGTRYAGAFLKLDPGWRRAPAPPDRERP